MYLKNLTVLGFKSFADKTALNFMPGITAVVGPNGCGKSNVADAIRWVLGEQSAKALRGGEMADVIFNGTDGRRPLGMAEVSLTIGDVDADQLKAAGVELAFNEVTLTRRVFRDGGSEYFINRTPCRLKDIQQLFMGTGVGRTSYSIMAQGNITQVLSSKPEDRRAIFEEAAGITRFKSHKRESLRKLEHTDQNLLRVADLIREVKRQIGSLQRQAGKARRYKQFMTEMQYLDTQMARHQYDVLQAQIGEKSATAESLRRQIEEASDQVLRSEDEIIQLRERLSSLEAEISQAQHQGLDLKGQIERHESRIGFNEERLREFERQNLAALDEIAQSGERRAAAEQELASVRERLNAALSSVTQHRADLQAKQEALRKIEADAQSRQDSLRRAQSDAFASAQQLSRARNEINSLDFQKQGNTVRLEKLSSEKIQLEEERARLEARLIEFEAGVEAERLNAQTQRGTVEERQQRLRDAQQGLAAAGVELDEFLRQQAGIRSRLNVLEQLHDAHEGFGAGAVAALKQAGAELGSLASRIRVPDGYVVAVENALGHHLQIVLAEQPETARQILEDLRTSKAGRASVASLGLRATTPAASVPLPAGAVPATSVVEADEIVRPLLDRLLGATLVVEDLQSATVAWREMPGQFDFVTRSGELLSRNGVFTGGYANGNGSGKTPSSILGRRNQISGLESQLTALQEQVNDASRRKGALQSEVTALQAGLQQAQTELRAQEVSIATRQGESNALQNSRRVLHQKIDTVVYEVQSLAAQEEEGSLKRAALAAQLTLLEQAESAAQALVQSLSGELESLRQARDLANTGLTESKVALAADEQVAASLGRQQQPLEQRLVELDQWIATRRSEIASFSGRKAQAESEIAESRARIEHLGLDRERINERAAEMLSRREVEEGEIASREEALRGRRRQLADFQQQRGALEVELAQINMSAQNLVEKIRQKYQVNLLDVRSECITITLAAEGPARVQTLTPEEMSAGGVATDWNAVGEQIAALQTRIDEMGPVNLVAIEEYEETEQRHAFLSKQHDDLVKAREQLLEVINRINKQTREMFTETFNKVRENFRAMFSEIFGGGKADLALVDEGDVLESGIEIMARPPGKQLQSISLLSGGEQTMTAVALLFAIYQVKPSPFCVLDELDAPLDESNINRFIRVLQRFLEHSQFIIITHNKRTIGMADVLYGVTMQEHGVSKIVSVKFHKTDEVVTDHTPTSIETPVEGASVEKEEDAPHKREETLEMVMAK
jgi:chromosome segregation protein